MSTSLKQLSFQDYRLHHGHGGPRKGAGRPVGPRPRVHHVRRPRVRRDHPSHVTVRVRPDVPSLRTRRFLKEFRRTLRAASERGDFRVVHYSVQRDHVHMLVESAGKHALGRGMMAVGARFSRAVNRVFKRRGPVVDGRYHLHVLSTPREVRNALAYILLNARRHWAKRRGTAPEVRLDEASSGRWFDGWRREPPGRRVRGSPEVARPHTWLLSRGWRRHRLIDPAEVPGG